VRGLLDDVIADARRAGGLSVLNQALVLRADLGYRTGEWQHALADATESVALARDAALSIHSAYALAMLSVLEAARGEERARDHARAAIELGRRHALRVVDECATFALAALELGQGRPADALEYLEPLAADVARTGRGEPAVVLWPADLIEALIATERRKDAGDALAALDAQARRTGGAWAEGVVARYQGVLADDAGIDAPFEHGLARHARSGMPFELARTRLCYGERLRRAGRRIDARVQLREALERFDALGAAGWAERARRELAASGQRLRRGPQRDRDRLTHQELQIARCVADGATNKEAAADLFLSPKTIETHLTRVYRKLGIRSRSELVAAMHES
jgi:DNA-binding CsgD family transcriptional regulator